MVQDIDAVRSVIVNKGISRLSIVGASIGANVALNYATQNDVKGLVLLSPGLDYRGVRGDIVLNQPFMIVASQDDTYSAESAQEIASINQNANLVLYDNVGHGTNMFVEPELAQRMLDWIST